MASSTIERILEEVKNLRPEELEELHQALDREAHLRQKRADANGSVQTVDISRELQWIDEHREEYAGQWVALRGERLLSSGPDGLTVYKAARQAGDERPFVTRVEPANELAFAGW